LIQGRLMIGEDRVDDDTMLIEQPQAGPMHDGSIESIAPHSRQ
jgi:hypothetical protein